MAFAMRPGSIRSAFQNATGPVPGPAMSPGGFGGLMGRIATPGIMGTPPAAQPMPSRWSGPATYTPPGAPGVYPPQIMGRMRPPMPGMPAPVQPTPAPVTNYAGMPRYNAFANQLAQAQMLRDPNLGISFS